MAQGRGMVGVLLLEKICDGCGLRLPTASSREGDEELSTARGDRAEARGQEAKGESGERREAAREKLAARHIAEIARFGVRVEDLAERLSCRRLRGVELIPCDGLWRAS